MQQDTLKHLVELYEVGDLLWHRLLVVDDEVFNCEVVADLLQDRYEVLQADSAETALRVFQEYNGELDAIITDQRMPGLSGVELLEKVRQSSPDIAGIVVTGYMDSGAMIAAINRAGAFRFISKPWEHEAMENAVSEAVESVYQRRAIRRLVSLLSDRNNELAEALKNLEKTQKKMLHMERLSTIGRLSAGISHEVRNFLSVLELMHGSRRKDMKASDVMETLDVVHPCVQNLLGTLEAMNQFSGEGVLEVLPEKIDPAEVAKDSLAVMRVDMDFRGRNVDVRIAPDLPGIMGDRRRLTQVFVNLLRNAVQATEKKDTISFRVLPANSEKVVFIVEDSGPGIPESVRENLFSPFVSSRGEKGMGMGLYLTKIIVESHGGKINVISRGKGTRIAVEL